MAKDRENIRGNISPDDYSLESILAEYKGTAFIDGDKKTPADVLNEKAEKIIMEVTGESTTEAAFSSASSAGTPTDKAEAVRTEEEPVRIQEAESTQQKSEEKTIDKDFLFFENYNIAPKITTQEIADEVERAIAKEQELERGTRNAVKKLFSLFGRVKRREEEDDGDGEEEREYEPEPEEIYEEPNLKDAARKFALAANSISLRYIASFLVSVISAMITFTYEAGLVVPIGIGRNMILTTGILVILQLIVMIFGIDIVIRGVTDIIRARPNAESLTVVTCVFTVVSGICSVIAADIFGILPLPYCAVSSFSMTFTLLGEQYYLKAMTETLKTASMSSEPYGIVAEYHKDISKTILKKTFRRTDSFYNNLMQPDIAATAYKYAAPLLLIGSLVLAVFITVTKGYGAYFTHILSALFAAAASFSSIIAFSGPYYSVAKTARRAGAAIAGWGGADDIWNTDGACVTDDDMFPAGTMSINGVKIFEEVSPEKAIRYTSSLIIASGSALSRVFSELLSKQGMTLIKVEEFVCYEGGIGALIRGERVMTGSAAFMNLLGIRIPDDINLKNAVFTSVNDKLIAMFAVNYVPINSVQNALISILKWRVKLFFAVRDFNITPLMLEQKFKVSIDDIEYIPTQNSYSISDNNASGTGRVAAVSLREGLGPFGEGITGGRILRAATLLSTILSVVTTVFGFLLMFYMCWIGAFESARAGNLLIFMLSMLAAVIVACGYVKCRK